MRNLLALVGLVVIGVAGVGWYLGWYKLNVTRTTDGNLQINTTVDTKKAETDSAAFFKNASTIIGSQIDKSGQSAPPDGTPGATPGPGAQGQTSAFNPLAPTAPTAPTAPAPGPGATGTTNTPPSPIKLIAPK